MSGQPFVIATCTLCGEAKKMGCRWPALWFGDHLREKHPDKLREIEAQEEQYHEEYNARVAPIEKELRLKYPAYANKRDLMHVREAKKGEKV